MKNRSIDELYGMAARIRRMAVEMAYLAGPKGAHLGGSLSSVELFAVLYGYVLNVDPNNPDDPDRDRLILGKEHGRLSEYPALMETGFISKEEVLSYLNNGNPLAGHPIDHKRGLEYSCCSLGMAFPTAIGIALDAKRRGYDYKVYTLMGDGELDEGSIWEAFMAGSNFELSNLTAIIDRNHLSSDGDTEGIMKLGDLNRKIESFGWECIMVEDGHKIEDLIEAFDKPTGDRPRAIVINTTKGKGISFVENCPEWHHGVMTDELYKQALSELGEIIEG